MPGFAHRERVRFGDLDAMRHIKYRLDFAMRVGERPCAEGYGVMVGFDYAAQRAAALPDDMRRRVEAEAVRRSAAA
jgi:acyl-CoA thioester hydrolase